MPSITPAIYAFSGVYIGDTGTGSPLTKISSLRTNGVRILETLPTDFVQSQSGPVQSGDNTFAVFLEFLGDDDIQTKIARGLSLSAGDASAVTTFTQYALFLVPPKATENAYYIPKARTNHEFGVSYTKKTATSIPVTLTAENRNITTRLFYRGTPASLASIMSAQYPL